MNCIESIQIVFPHKDQLYVGIVGVSRSPGLYYFSLFLEDRRVVFFVDDEQDCWMENNAGNTSLADAIGYCIDRHYHPDRFQDQQPLDPDESAFFH